MFIVQVLRCEGEGWVPEGCVAEMGGGGGGFGEEGGCVLGVERESSFMP